MANFVNYDGQNIEVELEATQDSHGLLSSQDKIKLDSIDIDELMVLNDTGVAEAIADENNQLLIDENNTIYVL